jgi:hypothetical protein
MFPSADTIFDKDLQLLPTLNRCAPLNWLLVVIYNSIHLKSIEFDKKQ